MKQFNDVVTYVRNGQEIPALVTASREVNGEERLQLAYLDPDNGEVQLAVHGTLSRAYSVAPLKEGVNSGWKEQDAAADAPTPSESPTPKIDLEPLTREQTRDLVFAQLDRGENASEPDGANLGDFIEALNDYLKLRVSEHQTTNTSLNEQVAQLKQAEHRWIPVTERLPDGSKYVPTPHTEPSEQTNQQVAESERTPPEPQKTDRAADEAPTAEVTTQP